MINASIEIKLQHKMLSALKLALHGGSLPSAVIDHMMEQGREKPLRQKIKSEDLRACMVAQLEQDTDDLLRVITGYKQPKQSADDSKPIRHEFKVV